MDNRLFNALEKERMKKTFFSKSYEIEVRGEIAKEFTNSSGEVNDMVKGLHEIRAKVSEEDIWLKKYMTA